MPNWRKHGALCPHDSVVKEGLYAARHGATAMHDITEGGVFGAAWEMAEASGCGMVLYPEKVLMHPITKNMPRSSASTLTG